MNDAMHEAGFVGSLSLGSQLDSRGVYLCHSSTPRTLSDTNEGRFTMTEKSKRGFASMDPKKVREIASLGGKAVHAQGRAHTWDSEEAKAAGRKGGAVISQDREHMQRIGRLGGAGKHRSKNSGV